MYRGPRLPRFTTSRSAERRTIVTVKLVLPERDKAVVKIRSKITKQPFDALRMRPGDVMLGVRKKPR